MPNSLPQLILVRDVIMFMNGWISCVASNIILYTTFRINFACLRKIVVHVCFHFLYCIGITAAVLE